MSALARAAARAAGASDVTPLMPALPSTSPLAQTDQRLNLPDFMNAFERGDVGLTGGLEQPAAPLVPAGDLPWVPPSSRTPDAIVPMPPAAREQRFRRDAGPTATETKAIEAAAEPRPLEPLAAGAAAVARALSAVDSWINTPAEGTRRLQPSSEHVAPARSSSHDGLQQGRAVLEPQTREQSVDSHRVAVPRRRTSDSTSTILEPRSAPGASPRTAPLPSHGGDLGFEAHVAAMAPPTAPLLKIGRIDVQVVRPPEPRPAPRMLASRFQPAARVVPAAAPPARAFGWRQR